jgi:nucleoside-diphosphate-sugar epimerase
LKWIRHLPAEFVQGDISDFHSLLPIIPGIDYVYHLGGLLRAKKESDFFRVNHEGTRNLLEACRFKNAGLKRFIFISSQAAVGPSTGSTPLTEDDPPHPISAYGKSKQLAEQAVMKYKNFFPVTIIRPPVVYGPRDGGVLTMFRYIKFGIKPLIGNHEKAISLIQVRDIVRGIHSAGEHIKAENKIFFIANKNGYSWNEVEDVIARIMEKKAVTIRFPEFVLDVAANLSEQVASIFKRTALISRDKAIEMKQNYWLVDSTKVEQKLNFTAQISLEDGIKETYNWYRSQGWL